MYKNFISDIPLLHSWDQGLTFNSGGFESNDLSELFDFINLNLNQSSIIIETGLGNTTLLFLLSKVEKVISICPEIDLINRFNIYRYRNFTEPVNRKHVLYTDVSSKILPAVISTQVDVALIDGSHSMPDVFIDFYYLNTMLKKGGYLMIDDVRLKSVEPLDLLISLQKNEYIFIKKIRDCNIYKKISNNKYFPEWNMCEYTK